MTSREVFATSLAVLAATFEKKLSPPAIEGYWIALESLTEEEFKQATGRALSNCKFMPAPAELLAFARPPKAANVDAIQAWQVVRKAIDKYDYMVGTIDFGPLVNAVVRNLGGWDTLCTATLPELDNPGWLRKKFEEIYKALATADPTTLHGEELDGALPPKWVNPPHVIVPVDGSPPRLRLEASGADEARKSIQAHVRGLADDKS